MSTSEKSVFVVRKETSSSVREGRDLRFLPRKSAARHFRELWTVIIISLQSSSASGVMYLETCHSVGKLDSFVSFVRRGGGFNGEIRESRFCRGLLIVFIIITVAATIIMVLTSVGHTHAAGHYVLLFLIQRSFTYSYNAGRRKMNESPTSN